MHFTYVQKLLENVIGRVMKFMANDFNEFSNPMVFFSFSIPAVQSISRPAIVAEFGFV